MTSVDRSTWGPASAAVSDSLGVALVGLGIFTIGYYLGYVLSNADGVLIDWLGGRTVLTGVRSRLGEPPLRRAGRWLLDLPAIHNI